MATKTVHDKSVLSVVTSGSTDYLETPVIPSGKMATVLHFGCAIPPGTDGTTGIVILEWGSGSSWAIIKAFSSDADMKVNKDYLGDGTKKFRLGRYNMSSSSKPIAAWGEILVHDL